MRARIDLMSCRQTLGTAWIAAVALCVAFASGPTYAGSPAVRVGHATSHGGVVQEGSGTVLVGGVLAARVGDRVGCSLVCGPGIPHVGGAIATGSSTVFIDGRRAAFQGSVVNEACATSSVVGGLSTVQIGP